MLLGGTVDVTAHRTLKGGKIEEILPASGGPWGGIYVDRQFAHLLEDIFGKDFLNRYKSAHPEGWFQLISSFETTKKPFNGADQKSLRVAMPWSFGDFHSEHKGGKSIKNSVQAYNHPDISFTNGTIVIQYKTAKQMFSQMLGHITTHVKALLKDPKLATCMYIFMVGGFSESRLLQDQIKRNFEKNDTKVLIPSEAQLAVLKGAVLFGHFPTEITTRIARLSYGCDVSKRFDPEIHDTNKMYKTDDGSKWCIDIFQTLVKQGDTISIGKEISHNAYCASKDITEISTMIYSIDGQPRQPVQYVDSPEVEYLGKIVTKLTPCTHVDENILTRVFTFGGTEIHVRVVHEATGKENTTSVDFVSHASAE